MKKLKKKLKQDAQKADEKTNPHKLTARWRKKGDDILIISIRGKIVMLYYLYSHHLMVPFRWGRGCRRPRRWPLLSRPPRPRLSSHGWTTSNDNKHQKTKDEQKKTCTKNIFSHIFVTRQGQKIKIKIYIALHIVKSFISYNC